MWNKKGAHTHNINTFLSNMNLFFFCILVCVVCNPLKEHVVANSAMCVVTVNGRDAPKLKFWAERILDVLGRKQKPKLLEITIYLLNTI